jgi:hypothetical protein
MKQGDPSKSVAEAVKWRALDQTVAEARSKFSEIPPEEPELLVDEAVAAARRDNTRKAG